MAGIVVVASQKGGCGKTTLSAHLAGRLRELDPQRPLICVDADPQEQLTKWLGEAAPDVYVERVHDAESMLRNVPLWGDEADRDTDRPQDQVSRVVIDCAGGDSELMRAAMIRADLVVVPCAGSMLDLSAAAATWNMVQLVRDICNNEERPAMVFAPSRMTPTKVSAEVFESLSEYEEPILEPAIPQRASIADAAGQSAFVWDLANAGDTAELMRSACDAILSRVSPKPWVS
jgi:chromosome partitioning protein